jgi:hypothetical protein
VVKCRLSHRWSDENSQEALAVKEIYIFRPEDHTTEELWQIVQEREQLRRDGAIGDCLMRKLAQREAKDTYTVLSTWRALPIAHQPICSNTTSHFVFKNNDRRSFSHI